MAKKRSGRYQRLRKSYMTWSHRYTVIIVSNISQHVYSALHFTGKAILDLKWKRIPVH